jgi:hypothetical protein
MSTERIEHALKEIEDSLPAGRAQVRFDLYGGGFDESFIRGSRAAIARLGVRLIRAAFQPEQQKSINGAPQIESALDDIVHPSSDVKFDWIELSDDLDREPEIQVRTRRGLRRASLIGWIFIAFALIAFLVWRLR